MCIACEMAFMDMLDALAPEERARILREQAERFACEPAADETPAQNLEDERKP
jgi:hypothetical protein